MSRSILITVYVLCHCIIYGQESAAVTVLKNINNGTLSQSCLPDDHGRLISNRAMNIYLSDRVGYYFANYKDLSLYKNSVALDWQQRSIAINHHIYVANDNDERVRSLFTIGAKATARHEFGFQLRYTWISQGKTFFNGCAPGGQGQKQDMDIQRAAILYRLKDQIEKELSDFEKQLAVMDPATVPGQDISTVKTGLRSQFQDELVIKYRSLFNEQQAAAFLQRKPYRLITVNWTDVHVYLPVASELLYLQPVTGTGLEEKHPWLWELAINHTQLIESKRIGRILLQLNSSVGQASAAQTGMVNKTGAIGNASIYSAMNYSDFLAGAVGAKLVYLPPDWHFGLSGSIQKYFGNYHALDIMAGFPVVLINRNGTPVINFEFQWRFFNLNHLVLPNGLTNQ